MNAIVLRSRITRPYNVRRFAQFAEASSLNKPLCVYGAHKISIGAHSLILNGVSLSVDGPGWGRPGNVLEIGSRVGIRPWVTISAAEQVVIEDDVIIGSFSCVL